MNKIDEFYEIIFTIAFTPEGGSQLIVKLV